MPRGGGTNDPCSNSNDNSDTDDDEATLMPVQPSSEASNGCGSAITAINEAMQGDGRMMTTVSLLKSLSSFEGKWWQEVFLPVGLLLTAHLLLGFLTELLYHHNAPHVGLRE